MPGIKSLVHLYMFLIFFRFANRNTSRNAAIVIPEAIFFIADRLVFGVENNVVLNS